MVSGPVRRALLGPPSCAGAAGRVAKLSQRRPPTLDPSSALIQGRGLNTSARTLLPKSPQASRSIFCSLQALRICVPSELVLKISPQSSLECTPLRHPTIGLGIARQFHSSRVAAQNLQDESRSAVQKDTIKTAVLLSTNTEADSPTDQAEKIIPGNSQEHHGLVRSERATRAAQVNTRARLSKEGKEPRKLWASLREVWRLFQIARPEFKALSLAIALLLVSSAISISIPAMVGKIMDTATSTTAEDTRLFGLTLYQFFPAFGMFLTLGACANYGRIIMLRIIGERVVARLRSQLFRRTYGQDAEFFDANRVGDLISRFGADTVIVGKSITQNVSDGLRSFISSIAGLLAMAWVSPPLVTIMLYTTPLIGGASFLYSRVTRRLSREMQRNVGALTKIAEERLGNVKTSQAFVGEAQEVRRYNKQVKKIFEVGKKQAFYDATYFSWNGWIGNMMIIALLWSGGGMVRDGLMSVGDLTTFMMYAVWAGTSLFGVGNFLSELMKGVGAATRLFELQDRRTTIPPTPGLKVKSAQGPIKFSNVTFAYPTRPAVPIFNGLDFEIPSGSNVCIVGPSGGGKSTVSSLLLRFYNPTGGTITINGVDITKMNAKSLRRRIGMVAQEPVLFSGTVAENIAYGKPAATMAEILMAAEKANCTSFLKDFPQGLETQVGARGAQISGGQKQRIAIARALLKDPDILILDEATSALDAESETAVNSALAGLMQGRSTTISIAHRLSTIKRSDKIIVLNSEGAVAEIGSYQELSANPKSAFSRLMEWQMTGGEVVDPPNKRPPQLTESEIMEEELVEEEEEENEENEDEGDERELREEGGQRQQHERKEAQGKGKGHE
ncbi:ATP-dependent permease MDL1 [Biscogniauxia mediterranea]|nr:ATP-dependent permease MDL1 [Biscogniauxia mediterranea]